MTLLQAIKTGKRFSLKEFEKMNILDVWLRYDPEIDEIVNVYNNRYIITVSDIKRNDWIVEPNKSFSQLLKEKDV